MNYQKDILLIDALKRIRRLERRMTGWHAAIINATKNADRIVLANDADSIRLDLDTVYSLIENEIDQRSREG